MTMTRTITFLAIIVALAACGDNAPQGAEKTPESVQACDLLTTRDIEEVTGQAMQDGEMRHNVFCRYASVAQNPNGVSNQQLMVRLSQSSSTPDESVRQYTEMMKQGMGADVDGYSVTPVAGIGDHALWEAYNGVNQLVIFKSDAEGATHTVIIQPDGFGSEQQSLEYAQALARRALDRF